MGVAESLLVGFDSHIRFHHGRTGDIIRYPIFQHIAHAADGAAVPGFKYLADRDTGDIFPHKIRSFFLPHAKN